MQLRWGFLMVYHVSSKQKNNDSKNDAIKIRTEYNIFFSIDWFFFQIGSL